MRFHGQTFSAITAIFLIGISNAYSASETTAAQRFQQFEALLIRAARIDLTADITIQGNNPQGKIESRIGIASPNIVVTDLRGVYDNKPVHILFRSNGIVAIVSRDGTQKSFRSGRDMRDAVRTGFSRFGLFYHIERIIRGTPPEHEDGGIQTWVTIGNVHYAKSQSAREVVLAFDLKIDGKAAGWARLALDKTNLTPLRREQTLTLGGRSFRTEETYSGFSLSP